MLQVLCCCLHENHSYTGQGDTRTPSRQVCMTMPGCKYIFHNSILSAIDKDDDYNAYHAYAMFPSALLCQQAQSPSDMPFRYTALHGHVNCISSAPGSPPAALESTAYYCMSVVSENKHPALCIATENCRCKYNG